jgi:hemerythrin-like metal-binding protein
MEFSCEWNETYSTGAAHIDNQHKMIFKLANSISAKNTRQEIMSCVLALYKYTREHFNDEEFLMEQINYPETKSHKDLHDSLISELNSITKMQFLNNESIDDFKAFVIKWIVDHIMIHDKRFIVFMKNRKEQISHE